MTMPTLLEAFSKRFLRGVFATYPARAANMGLARLRWPSDGLWPIAIAKRVSDLKLTMTN